MFYRVTRYEFDDGLEGDIAAWADTKTEAIRAIRGLVSVEAFNAAPGEGVIVAAYESEQALEAASATIKDVLGELGAFLAGPPETLSGRPFWTTRVDSAASVV